MNTNHNTPSATSATTARILTTPESVKFAQLDTDQATGRKLISINFRNPARHCSLLVPDDAWYEMGKALSTAEAAAYRPLLDAVLESAAKRILTRRLGDLSVWPSEIDTSIFSGDAILGEATTGNTEWLSKEELTKAWEASATRKALITDPRYAAPTGKAYRAAVAMFAELIIKLAGKTSAYTESELDKMLVKLHEDDHATEFGTFVLRRIEQIRNKPVKSSVDLDCL